MTFDRHLPLDERIIRIDHIQARRYSKLVGVAAEIATEGILRHLRACDRMDVNPVTLRYVKSSMMLLTAAGFLLRRPNKRKPRKAVNSA